MSKEQLVFDTTDLVTKAQSDSVGAYVRSSKSGALITNHSLIKAAGTPFNFVDGDVTVGTDSIAETAHGYKTGDLVQLTSSGTLPAGLALATDYYVIRVDDNNIQLAADAEDAENGIPVDITAAAGGGTHTVTGFEQEARFLDVYSALADGEGNPLSSTGGALDVNILGGVNVEVDLSHLDDSVRLGDGTSFFTSTSENSDIALDVHISNSSIEVTATDLDIRDLTQADEITVFQGTSPWVIGDGGGSITIDGTVAATQSGSWSVNAIQSGTWTVGLSEDHNYGAVGANTLRTAAQIGNATGAADFNSGATTAQTLRVALATDTSFQVNDAALAETAIASASNTLGAANTPEDVVASPLADRKYLFIRNMDNKRVYIGPSGVSAANGYPLSPQQSMELRAGDAVDIEFVGETGATPEIRTLELS